jgi:hypothetical protein
MSHISVVESKVKMDDKRHLICALEKAKEQFEGFTYAESKDGKIIQVKYEKIDAPVRRYHPDGNLRFNEKNDGTWEMSGDSFACHNEYKQVCDALKVNYLQSGAIEHATNEGFSTEESVDEQGNLVVYLREY